MFPRYPEPDPRSKAYLDISYDAIRLNDPQTFLDSGGLIKNLAKSIGAKRILDLACGLNPIIPIAYQALGGKVEAIGADIDPDMLEAARKRYKETGMDFIEFDLENPHDIGRFDLVYFVNTLHHFDNVKGVLSTIYDILEDPGILYLFDVIGACPGYLSEEKIKRYVEERSRMVQEGGNTDRINQVLGYEADNRALLSIDSYLAAYTPEEITDAFKDSEFRKMKKKIHTKNGRHISVCAAKDSRDSVHIETGSKFFGVYVKGKNRLFLPRLVQTLRFLSQ